MSAGRHLIPQKRNSRKRSADRSPSTDATPELNRAHPGARVMLAAVAAFLDGCGVTLTTDQFVALAGVIYRATPARTADAEQQRQRADALAGALREFVDAYTDMEGDVINNRTDIAYERARAALQAASGTTRDEPGLDG